MVRKIVSVLSLVLAMILIPQMVFAQRDAVRREVVRFAPGASYAMLRGEIRGYGTVEYSLDARSGQRMNARLTPSNPSSYFNVIAPSGAPAIFIGSTEGNDYSGVLPETGTYTIIACRYSSYMGSMITTINRNITIDTRTRCSGT